ncbi:cupin domain-containing protein [Pedobacter mucosus]|uniref:cupin domain-containing protein n=1 Tax=Pedobacter mucosus TaxID=2895286 RepID=UPI001EE442A6|nr:cupin domain-containing protein [Pedobacter mucosus]UKT64274.1 cupin domain-containing protein [Pedobacter mucosus]
MKDNTKYLMLAFMALITSCIKSENVEVKESGIFPKGEKNKTKNFIGDVWVKSLVDADSLNENAVGNVTFAPGARSNWHSHPAGQIVLATEGVGYYQEKGKAKVTLRKGDIVKCPPNLPHWHGASPDVKFVQVAISSRSKGPAVWLDEVPDSVYLAK